MMTIRRYESAIRIPSDVGFVPRRCTPFRQMVLLACCEALLMAGWEVRQTGQETVGIALLTDYGERFPVLWRELKEQGKKLRPSHFEMAIHNSAAGHAAIELGLRGPQIVLVSGNIHLVAKLQLLSGRADLMLVCEANEGISAECYILEAV